MDTLTEFVQGECKSSLAEREDLRKLASDVATGLISLASDGRWPYQLDSGQPRGEEEAFSFSTHAMILHSLVAVLGPMERTVIAPAAQAPPFVDKDITAAFHRVRLSTVLAIQDAMIKAQQSSSHITLSTTFGPDDPLTLTLLLELDSDAFTRINASEPGAASLSLKPELHQALLLGAARRARAASSGNEVVPAFDPSNAEAANHPFPLLCLIRMEQALRIAEDQSGTMAVPTARNSADRAAFVDWKGRVALPFFRNIVYRNIAQSSLQAGEFDAAELVLSLEGELLCRPDGYVPDREFLWRAMTVLSEHQKKSVYWRPLRPVFVTPQGMVLLPVSVEIANSLLRLCFYVDGLQTGFSCFSYAIEQLRNYAGWLLARATQGSSTAGQYRGWSSEHIQKEGRIHTWETSQVLLFLGQYTTLLRDHLARRALSISAIEHKQFARNADPVTYWRDNWEKNEPSSCAAPASRLQIYGRMREDYILPHSLPPSRLKRRYSMLLYGPPGTGKTTIAEYMARSLGYRLITVTTSDFLASGPGDVERRAKELFKVLELQHRSVILFDEIDHFLLDRESRLYREQEGIFQFLTPGMLTKLKDLHSVKRPIFIIATNYVERIDRAAIRMGRIDDRYLVLPPDSCQRRTIITNALKVDLAQPLPRSETLDRVIEQTRLLVYGEIIELLRLSRSKAKTGDLDAALIDTAASYEPSITLSSYRNRFRTSGETRDIDFPTKLEPFEEFIHLVYLACERGWRAEELSTSGLTQQDRQLIQDVIARLADRPLGVPEIDQDLIPRLKALTSST
jgi:hypothetical protein